MRPHRLGRWCSHGRLVVVDLVGDGGIRELRFSGHEALDPAERALAELAILPSAVARAREYLELRRRPWVVLA